MCELHLIYSGSTTDSASNPYLCNILENVSGRSLVSSHRKPTHEEEEFKTYF